MNTRRSFIASVFGGIGALLVAPFVRWNKSHPVLPKWGDPITSNMRLISYKTDHLKADGSFVVECHYKEVDPKTARAFMERCEADFDAQLRARAEQTLRNLTNGRGIA